MVASFPRGFLICPSRIVSDSGTRPISSRGAGQAAWLVPSPLEGPIWGYCDFADGPLEDLTFRIASPEVRDSWPSPSDRALYVMNKERKFGAGCVDAWQRDRELLLSRAQTLLEPSVSTLRKQSFLFGERPTLADAALYGSLLMLEVAGPALVAALSPTLVEYSSRMREAVARA